MLVLSWAGHVEFEALSVEDLIVVKPWRGLVEANVLAREDFVVRSAALRGPLRPSVFEVILHLISCRAELLRALQDLLGIRFVEGAHFTFHLGTFRPSGRSLRLTDADQLVIYFESVGLRKENAVLLRALLFCGCQGPGRSLRPAFEIEIMLFLLLFLDHDEFAAVLAWVRAKFWIKP